MHHCSFSVKLQPPCLECIANQAQRVCELLSLNDADTVAIKELAHRQIQAFDDMLSPPHNATPLYEAIAGYLGVEDIYAQHKAAASLHAQSYISVCEQAITQAKDPLLAATKTAVAGNVIDLASVMLYDLAEEIQHIYEMPFAIDDFENLKKTLSICSRLVYLADNAGEEVFDKLYLKTLRTIFPQMECFYFVRGRPIINDLTYAEAVVAGMHDVAQIVDSGVPTPGLALEYMTKEARNIFDKADCIIAKGMGNYECLSEHHSLPIFYLFKVKCAVVAHSVGASLGDIVCKKSD